ncbi:helix-turn-helix transcriptional regulator [Streptomyces ipomoeae]|uniref:DNA-binding helix-turn-helix protein n=1 Tax=Streptomyces ipomoeae 91-03 TaxID=698759 RepID=L1KL27_9ACTN|nr:helix-turn-helix transcriptional regulator [Streptomyces ipomoeae]EKX61516.1 DNA-binding helix-turn-helix protein [Streptomyces ipomoeae 91-03]MDX2697384.1 helix-turn-helix transcriptional regulator [Streptomyces ipomoeae]MDX2826178.1 helix-turn-helix transcriptional regulator [Streptomyces ipomoeae]MDX2845677.1 helix-turn-helix transcriptional regulator [Streptomyces ipomoeae]MDX2877557.1 helix-turn-helix transcriptional regulator [Streptomyces ipomoeae]
MDEQPEPAQEPPTGQTARRTTGPAEATATGATATGAAGTAGALDRRAELSEFLRTRRARLKPEDVGLPTFGRHRRVPGLRREELAQLAGVSVAYYTRLEQGNGRNVSTEVLDSIARALRLTAAEHAHLTHLAKPKAHKKKPSARPQQVRSSLRQLIDTLDGVPAYVTGRRSDILVWNRMAAAVFGDWSELPPQERNWARMVFLRPDYRDLYVDWDQKAADMVSYLRMDAGCHPDDPRLSALVGELSVKSEEFRRLWATHDVREKSHGIKRLHHPLVGDLTLSFETFALPNDQEQSLITYHAEPGSPSADALRLLSSWTTDTTRPTSTTR